MSKVPASELPHIVEYQATRIAELEALLGELRAVLTTCSSKRGGKTAACKYIADLEVQLAEARAAAEQREAACAATAKDLSRLRAMVADAYGLTEHGSLRRIVVELDKIRSAQITEAGAAFLARLRAAEKVCTVGLRYLNARNDCSLNIPVEAEYIDRCEQGLFVVVTAWLAAKGGGDARADL